MKKYAQLQMAMLLRRLVFQLSRAARARGPEAVHDLRVAIRRFSRALRTFEPFAGREPARRIRRKLRGLMRLAGRVRDRDMALELLSAAGLAPRARPMVALRRERAAAGETLAAEIGRWNRRGTAPKWRARLEL